VTASAQDLELLKSAEEAAFLEQYLVAGRLLHRVSHQSLLNQKHRKWLEMSAQSEHVMKDLLTPYPEESGWSKLSEAHGHRDTLIYYRIDEQYRLTCRIETPIEESMLVPLLAVCNETDIFHAAGESVMVKDFGRGNQVSHVLFATPFPFANREMYQYAFAVDEIDESAAIIVKIRSLDPGTYDGATVPEPAGKLVRVDYDSGILIRSCPEDHPTLQHSKGNYPPNEKLLLLSATSTFDAHIHVVPVRLINYVTRIMIGYVWGNLLKTSEEVRDGKRPAHTEAIQRNPELYGWVEERIQVMLAKLEQEQEESGEEEDTQVVEDGKMAKSRKGRFHFRNPFRRGGGRKRKGRQECAVSETKLEKAVQLRVESSPKSK